MSTDTSKLTIRLPKDDLQFAKTYAKDHGITVTELIDRYLRRMQRGQNGLRSQEVSKITGLIPKDIDPVDEYRKHLLKKHSQ